MIFSNLRLKGGELKFEDEQGGFRRSRGFVSKVQSGGLLVVSGEETRGLILNSTPPNLLSFFENQRSRDETAFVSRSRTWEGWGGGAAPHLWSGRKGRRENGPLF